MVAEISQERIELALRIADVAGDIVRARFRRPFQHETKNDLSPVTEVDRLVEQACRKLVTENHRGDGVIGEEFGTENPEAAWQWIIDPIDGTRAFMAGRPTFGTLIAVAHRGEPVLGIVDQPITRDRWLGVVGRSTVLNGEVVKARACASLRDAVLSTTSPELFGSAHAYSWETIRAATGSCVYGGDCTAYAAVASGWLDIVVEANLKVYDYAALVPVLMGSGGVISDWDGRPLDLQSDGRVLAVGDPHLQTAALSALRASRP
jgi:inositol-phosphate phosphatase/L-galactose 1-phosphate phosphatase/histidinol-phosphatase